MNPDALPLVSVVIAFLNEEQFLGEAVESVLYQDYSNWELLLVDDGSTDRSTAMAKQYAAQMPDKIIYCEHDGHLNKGLSASRNHGIKKAKGNYVAFLDADDIWKTSKLSNQIAIFQKYPDVTMVAEASLYWNSWSNPENKDISIPVGAPGDQVYQPGELLLLLYPLGTTAAPCPSGLMITKQGCLSSGGFEESFRGDCQLYEDQAFLSKVYTNEKVYISSACNNLYRQRHGSIVQAVKDNGHYHTVRKYFLEWLSSYLLEQGVINHKLVVALKKSLEPYHHPYIYSFKKLAARIIYKIIR
ncbi:glycosyltransferase [Hymenobacter jejuensis]|uniref:Glycosyltransferase family 2 protein n=1 Tax=Hymenobacter jejuensis TaxID=2502781 RepID=A0A5B7ZXN7_9BACT|nr:glycosyltransferase [Hymenobacter jejuensis]QDA59273.1 glycosyltransferase family 2 protein [Hymenobacter jejuensis]